MSSSSPVSAIASQTTWRWRIVPDLQKDGVHRFTGQHTYQFDPGCHCRIWAGQHWCMGPRKATFTSRRDINQWFQVQFVLMKGPLHLSDSERCQTILCKTAFVTRTRARYAPPLASRPRTPSHFKRELTLLKNAEVALRLKIALSSP